MVNKIYTSIFDYRKKRFLSKNQREKRFVNYDKANSILILFESDEDEKNVYIKEIIKKLKSENKTVFAIGFTDKKEINSTESIYYILFNYKKCDWTKQPHEDIIQKLFLQKYDLLINLAPRTSLIPLNYLLLFSDSACKAGTTRNNDALLDFAIQVPPEVKKDKEESVEVIDNIPPKATTIDEKYIFENIIFYLKSIQTTD